MSEQPKVPTLKVPTTKAEKFKAVATVGKVFDKKLGTKTFQRQGDKVNKPIPCIPTNMPSVDRVVLGCGGVPRGRIIEVYGPESAGKTAWCLHVIAQCQKAGGVCAFIDAEHALSPTFANRLGVSMDELIISQPDCGEDALDIVEALVESQGVDIIVVDSVTALVPRAELNGDMGDSHMGLQARLMSQAMRKLAAICSKNGVTVIFINQIREKVGLVFGSPEVTTGGRALKFYASIRIEIRRVAGSKGGTLLDGDKLVFGHLVNIKAVKNKVAMPFRETIVELDYVTGFQADQDLFEHAKKIGVLTGTAKFVINGTGSKYAKEDLPMDTVRAAVDHFYAELVTQLINGDEHEEAGEETAEANTEG
jgi:recombination protein RecA